MRFNTNKNPGRLLFLTTALIVMALFSACGGKTDGVADADSLRLKQLRQIDDLL